MAKSNRGSSYPNQGENRGTSGVRGGNISRGAKSSKPKYGASVHKGQGSQSRRGPDYLP